MGNDSVFKTLKVSSHILHKYSELLNKRADQKKRFKKIVEREDCFIYYMKHCENSGTFSNLLHEKLKL